MSFAEGTPTATVQLDKPRTLGFTLGAMRRCRDLGVLNIDVQNETAMMLALPEYVWSCMDDAGRKELPLEQVMELIHPGNVQVIAEAIGALFASSQPKTDPEKNAGPAAVTMPTAGSTSMSSGQLESTISV